MGVGWHGKDFLQTMSVDPLPFFFFFNDTATTEIYTLSLHDALPISTHRKPRFCIHRIRNTSRAVMITPISRDRKSTRLNSSHSQISYAVFCLKKKKNACHSAGGGRGAAHRTRPATSWLHRSPPQTCL